MNNTASTSACSYSDGTSARHKPLLLPFRMAHNMFSAHNWMYLWCLQLVAVYPDNMQVNSPNTPHVSGEHQHAFGYLFQPSEVASMIYCPFWTTLCLFTLFELVHALRHHSEENSSTRFSIFRDSLFTATLIARLCDLLAIRREGSVQIPFNCSER